MRPVPAALALVFAVSAAEAAATTHPVPLQASDCPVATDEASAFTGHALFEYVIEASGTVDRINLLYADVLPAERRSAFIAELTSCLQKWAFKPASVGGVPAATLMKVAFHRLPTDRYADLVALPGGRAVPASLVQEMRSATLAFTETLLKGPNYKEARGDGWRLRTDLPKSALDDVQDAIDFTRRALQEILPGQPASAVDLKDSDVTLVLFKDMEKYRQVSAFDNVVPERAPTLGEYDREFRLIYAAVGDRPIPYFARVMAHEATHHFLAQRLSGSEARLPRWMDEGLAQYIQCLKPSKGKVRLDELDRGKVSWVRPATGPNGERGVQVLRKRAETAVENLQQNLADVDPGALVDGRLDRHFFDEKGETLYDVSWLLVHFLMNGDEGRHRDAFRAWVLDSGAKDSATLATATHIPAADLPALLSAHLKGIR
ncbi:MAG TPA: hypothetical protein VGQ67_06945 [Candidatus Polarisedimenticolia bacterium]|nr:hypothetical protein [Candidatus Polarisedimenticolia bacterium]